MRQKVEAMKMNKHSFDLFDKSSLSTIGDVAKTYYRENTMPGFTSEQAIARCYVDAVLGEAFRNNLITFTDKAKDIHEKVSKRS